MHFDRVVSQNLLDALRPDGPLHGAVTWCAGDPSLRDLQLRRAPKGPTSWASLYVGLTSVLDVVEQHGQFRVTAHTTHRAAGGFNAAWGAWQSIGDLTAAWPEVRGYLDAAAAKVHGRWTDSEGRVHALLSTSPHTGVTLINRETSVSFSNQPTKDQLCEGWATALTALLRADGRSEPWWINQLEKRLGTSPDFLAVDDAGRLLVIEAKPASAAAGITWSPAQVTFYSTMYAAWLAEAGEAARTSLEQQLSQRRTLGLVPGDADRQLAWPPIVVPVLAIGPGMVSPEVWGRLDAVATTLRPAASGLAPLEIWRLTSDGHPRVVDQKTMVLSYPVATQDDMNTSTYEDRARAAAVAWKLTSPDLPEPARADGPYGGKANLYPFCLPTEFAERNLLPEASDAVNFFAERRIQWHRGIGKGPTNHLVSSQVQCVNALFPMTTDPAGPTRAFGDVLQIEEVLKLDDAFLTFEYNGGGIDYLGEGRPGKLLTRGANSTSTDAAFAFRSPFGTELVLVEWKYTEKYLGSRLSEDRKGVRELRYGAWYDAKDGPLDPTVVPYELIFVEPLYQLVRQQLLAWRIEQAGLYDRVRVVHISPFTNREYGESLDRHKHRLAGETVSDVWKRMLRESHRDRFLSLDSAMFTDPGRNLASTAYRSRYGHV